MPQLKLEQTAEGIVLAVKAVPGASRTMIAGLLGDMLKVRLSAPPEKGKANRQLLEFLAERLGVNKNNLTIVSGQTNPIKHVRVVGISADRLRERLHIQQRGGTR